jgi:pimeloyl-ACP methyl ester carboxylesterase
MASALCQVHTSHRHSERLHLEVHASQLQIIDQIGHMVQHSAPGQVAAIIARAP